MSSASRFHRADAAVRSWSPVSVKRSDQEKQSAVVRSYSSGLLAKVRVAGSNPVVRSRIIPGQGAAREVETASYQRWAEWPAPYFLVFLAVLNLAVQAGDWMAGPFNLDTLQMSSVTHLHARSADFGTPYYSSGVLTHF
jgi:hypothetical protein